MNARDPAPASGLVVIRVWIEPACGDSPDHGMRARITTAEGPELAIESTFTAAGVDGVLAVVRTFLERLGTDELQPSGGRNSEEPSP